MLDFGLAVHSLAVIMDDLSRILEATLSPDTQAIQQAQHHLEQAAKENLVRLGFAAV